MDRVSEYLKAQREARNVTLEELSKGTLISVAVLKDIEAGRFEKYRGDELYVKMYLKRIAEFLGIDSQELINDYISLSQEIQLDDLRKKQEQVYTDKKTSATFVGKLGETIKDIKPSSSLQKPKAKRVYEDNYIMRYLKYGLILLLCVVIVFVIWYSIVASKSSDNTPYTPPESGEVEKNPDAATNQDPKEEDKENKEDTEDNKEITDVTPSIGLTSAGGSSYEATGIKVGETLKIEVIFKAPGYFNLWKNNASVEGAYKSYVPEEIYVYEAPVVVGERFYFNFWNLSNAEIKVNGQVLNYDPTSVTVLQGGVSSISLLMKGE